MNILLSGIGRRTYLAKYFQTSLQGIGEVHVSNSEHTLATLSAKHKIITPLSHESGYIDILIAYCKKHDIKAIISCFDLDTLSLSQYIKNFNREGITVVASDYFTVRLCIDKWKSYSFLKSNDFLTPKTCLGADQALKIIASNKMRFPLIIKPRWGMGSIGVFEAENLEEFYVLVNKTKACIQTSYLKYIDIGNKKGNVIIQEKIMGEEYGLDVLNDLKNNFVACVPKVKLSIRAGETHAAKVIYDSDLHDLGIKLAKSLRHRGNLDVDLIKKDDAYYVIDMNNRFGGQYPFSHLAGVDFPKAIIHMLSGKEVDKHLLEFQPNTIGIKDIVPVKVYS